MLTMPGAEPYHHEGGEVGVLVCHGFTGTPHSVRPWARFLAAHGLTVALPLLPGHGTRWQDLQVTAWQDWYAAVEADFLRLRERCTHVFVVGLSMGGGLALWLAARHGPAVAGLVLVNPSVRRDDPRMALLPVLRHLLPTVSGIRGDIAKPGVVEVGYDRVPLHAAATLDQFWKALGPRLPQVTQPLLLLHSAQDHVVSPRNSALVRGRVSSDDVQDKLLEHSFHTATLDYDADAVFSDSMAFIRRLSPSVVRASSEAGQR